MWWFRRVISITVSACAVAAASVIPGAAEARAAHPIATPEVEGPIPGAPPGDPSSPDPEDTYPWFATHVGLADAGYVEEEFYLSGRADAYAPDGTRVGRDVPYRTRILVRRPARPAQFNGTVLMEWQNVTAGFDLDALWEHRHITGEGYAWVGVSAQRVGVDHLRGWSPARYGDLDVTGDDRFTGDEMSYDIFSQAALSLRKREGAAPLGNLRPTTILATGASQSAGRMTVYYDAVLPRIRGVFDGYAFIVGPAPRREGSEPVFQVLSETDVRSPERPEDTGRFRRWEVAGTAHSGWQGQEYRRPLFERDLGEAPEYDCERPPFSRVPLHHVVGAAHNHLARWAAKGVAPPTAEHLEFNPDGTKARDELGLSRGGIRLSQVEAPVALNTGDNAGESFCRLFGTHIPFGEDRLRELYPSKGAYLAAVIKADRRAVRGGFITRAQARENLREAIAFDLPR